jgi:hypothetical protein
LPEDKGMYVSPSGKPSHKLAEFNW